MHGLKVVALLVALCLAGCATARDSKLFGGSMMVAGLAAGLTYTAGQGYAIGQAPEGTSTSTAETSIGVAWGVAGTFVLGGLVAVVMGYMSSEEPAQPAAALSRYWKPTGQAGACPVFINKAVCEAGGKPCVEHPGAPGCPPMDDDRRK